MTNSLLVFGVAGPLRYARPPDLEMPVKQPFVKERCIAFAGAERKGGGYCDDRLQFNSCWRNYP